MKLDFTGQTALVTGASRGIGRQIALDLAECGADLILTSTRDGDTRLDDGPLDRHRHITVDFTHRESRDGFLAVLRDLPAIHVCINNAGATRHGPFEETTEAEWDATNDVNLKAPFFVTQAVAPQMKRQGYGRIVNISSIWGHISMPERSVYTATKFGLRGLATGYALELASYNVLVNVVSPGFTLTDMVRKNYSEERLQEIRRRIPMGRLADVEDISRAVLFLASGLNSYITGQSLVVDGGFTIA